MAKKPPLFLLPSVRPLSLSLYSPGSEQRSRREESPYRGDDDDDGDFRLSGAGRISDTANILKDNRWKFLVENGRKERTRFRRRRRKPFQKEGKANHNFPFTRSGGMNTL